MAQRIKNGRKLSKGQIKILFPITGDESDDSSPHATDHAVRETNVRVGEGPSMGQEEKKKKQELAGN